MPPAVAEQNIGVGPCVEGTSSLRPAVARGAAQVVEHGAQAVARGAARCATRVLGRGA
jgi:hypothetical protein